MFKSRFSLEKSDYICMSTIYFTTPHDFSYCHHDKTTQRWLGVGGPCPLQQASYNIHYKEASFLSSCWEMTKILLNRTQKQMWRAATCCSCQMCVCVCVRSSMICFMLFNVCLILFKAAALRLLPINHCHSAEPSKRISIPTEIAFPRRIPPEDLDCPHVVKFSWESH